MAKAARRRDRRMKFEVLILLARHIRARAREHERATHARGSAVAVCLVLCVSKCVCSNPGSRLGGVVWSRCDECRLSWEAGAGAHPRGRRRATSLLQSPVSIILTPHTHKHTHAHSHAHKQLNTINKNNPHSRSYCVSVSRHSAVVYVS